MKRTPTLEPPPVERQRKAAVPGDQTPPSDQSLETLRRLTSPEAATFSNRAARRAVLNIMEDAAAARNTADREVIDRQRAEEDLAAEFAATKLLQHLGSLLIRENTNSALYEEILKTAIALMHSDAGSFQMFDRKTNKLQMLAWKNFQPEAATVWQTITVETAALESSERVIVPDIKACEFLAGTPSLVHYERRGIRAVQSTPLISRTGQLVGIISTHWREPHAPGEPELRFLDLLARQAADAIERRHTEEKLRQKEQELEIVVNETPFLLTRCSRDLHYRFVSRAYAAMLGRAPKQIIGRPIVEIMGEAGFKAVLPHIEKVLRGEAVEYEAEIPFQNVGLRSLRVVYTPELDLTEKVSGWVASILDITEQKEAQRAVLERQTLLNEAQRLAHVGSWAWDPETDQTTGSGELFRIFGLDPSTQTFPNFKDQDGVLFPDESWQLVREAMAETVKTGCGYELDVPALRNGTSIWVTTRGELVRDLGGRIVGLRGTIQDITERKTAEEALRAAKEAAELANKAKDRFLAALSHELRTPLTPVLMTVASLEHDPALSADVREDLSMVKRNVELEVKLIDDLLDLNRIASGKLRLELETVDLNETVRRVCAICRPDAAGVGVKIEIALEEGACTVAADPARLQQVLWNLLKNAIKFTPEGGTVTVTTASHEDNRCVVRVRDTGLGIAPEVLPRIFNAFEQGHDRITRQFGGMGLGLAISKALVELHGGTIRAESEGVGLGTTFEITWPAQTAVEASPELALPASGNARLLRVLLVEDHFDTAQTLRRQLRAAGYVVTLASDVSGALAATDRESFDVLVSDIGLPDGDGYEVMGKVRETHSIPGIAMSGYGMDDDVRRSREAGFTEHLVKPIEITQLVAAIDRVAENRG
jgi:PAS domain S-box-containing protein